MSVYGGTKIILDGLVHYYNALSYKSYNTPNENWLPYNVADLSSATGISSYYTSTLNWPNYEKGKKSVKVTTTTNIYPDGVILGDQSYTKQLNGQFSTSALVWCPTGKSLYMGFRYYPYGEESAVTINGTNSWQYVKRENKTLLTTGAVHGSIALQFRETATGLSPFTFYIAEPMISSGSGCSPFIVGSITNMLAGGGGFKDISNALPKLDNNLNTVSNDTYGLLNKSGNYIALSANGTKLSNVMGSGLAYSTECWFLSLGDPWSQYDGYIFGRQGYHTGPYQRKGYNGTGIANGLLWYHNNGTLSLGYSTIETGKWYHIGLVVDDSGKYTKSYLNGKMSASGSITNAIKVYSPSSPFFIGRGSQNYDCNGRIWITRIYNKALSDNEMLNNFDAEKGLFRL
jgi:hypothetical protein